MQESSSQDNDGIAIIGMAGKFPGAQNTDQLWRNLCEGVESITFFDEKELDSSIPKSVINQKNYVKAKGIIKDADKFDADFFNVTPTEAEFMDPQQRVFLETAWEALENAAIIPESYPGLIGLYAGSWRSTYYENLIKHHQDKIGFYGDYQTYLVNGPDYLATRVSYKLNLKGPSITVQTGCSTSLIAVALAYDSLLTYQCDVALAGGVYISCPINRGYFYYEGDMRSKDGHCRPFDKEATGTIFSDGVGIVVLKRLSEALMDGDTIYAVIIGSAVNNDGSDKVGFTAPSVKGQAEVIEMALANAGVDAQSITFIECHGTGTTLGDPIEIEALNQVYKKSTNKTGYCSIGSIKSNIGHLDAAAGVAGLIKTTLALYNKKIPATLHFKEINPKIRLDRSPFYVNTALIEWDSKAPRRAAISSFGVGGTNAHLILEEYRLKNETHERKQWDILPISAKDEKVAEEGLKRLLGYLDCHREASLSNIAYTLKKGRSRFNHQIIIACSSIKDAIHTIKNSDASKVDRSHIEQKDTGVIFLFPGQGSQYAGMCADLYHNESTFKDSIDRCCATLADIIHIDLRDYIVNCPRNDTLINQELEKTYITQPALFIVEYALATLLISWQVNPDAMIGHSIGEYVAACIAGVFDVESGIRIAAERGRLLYQQPQGSMLAVFASEDEIKSHLMSVEVSIAAINSPDICVLSGNQEAIAKIKSDFEANGIKHRPLHTSHAFHSAMMEPALKPFRQFLAGAILNAPQIPFLSNVSGTWITEAEATSPDYWASHIRSTVRFADAVSKLVRGENRIFLEVGPGTTLSSLASLQFTDQNGHLSLHTIPHPKENRSDIVQFYIAVGKLWFAGVDIDWQEFYRNNLPDRIPLPTYPFKRETYWIRTPLEQAESKRQSLFKHNKIASWIQRTKQSLSPSDWIDSKKNEASVQVALLEIWRKYLGKKNLTVEDNYFELGGTSLMAVRIFAEIEKQFGVRLPLAILYKAPTVSELTERIEGKISDVTWDPLVQIKAGDHGAIKLFCIHAEGGNVLEYRKMANYLPGNVSVYGLQAKGLDGNINDVPTVKLMAKEYLSEIKKVQAHGPYYICGYCLGGYVAYEIGRQLLAENADLQFLGLINAGTTDYLNDFVKAYSFLHKFIFRITERVVLEIDNLRMLSPNGKLQYFFERIWRLTNLLRIRLVNHMVVMFKKLNIGVKQTAQGYKLQMLTDLQNQAFRNYRPEESELQPVLFNVKNQPLGLRKDDSLGWSKYVGSGIECFRLDGFHKNILKDPYVKALSEAMALFLNSEQGQKGNRTSELHSNLIQENRSSFRILDRVRESR